MKKLAHLLLLPILTCLAQTSYAEKQTAPANDIEYPKGLVNWRAIGTSIRNDNNTQRVILGNALAIKAVRAQPKNTNWPKGAILAKLVWKNETLSTWQAATVPGDFVHAEIMVRDSKKYKATGGWGFARWTGLELTPHGKDSTAAQACFDCHQAAKQMDYVFTQPAKLP